MSYSLPTLPFSPEALEPHIDSQTMQIHHGKHHQTYVDKLNATLPEVLKAQPKFENQPIETLLCNLDQIPESVRAAVRNHGGGHYNHSLFWESLAPTGQGGGGEPSGELAQKIALAFGSFAVFTEKFTEAATARFGSGWAWLVLNANGQMAITHTPNQDNPIMDDRTVTPLLGLDVWEHAYYLKYQNRRPDYIKAWWNVVNWTKIEERAAAAAK